MRTGPRNSRISAAAAALVLVMAACGGSDTAGTTTTAAGGSNDSTTTTTAAGGESTTTTSGETTTTTGADSTTTTTTEPAVPDFSTLANDATLEELFEVLGAQSFKQRFSVSITSEDPEQSGSFESVYEYIDEPRSLRLTWGGATGTDAEESIQIITIEDQTWIFEGGTWEEVPAEVSGFLLSSLVVPLSGTFTDGLREYGSGADFVGNDSVNGRATLHFRFDLSAFPAEQGVTFDDLQGDAWIDEETGVLIKAEYTGSGNDPEIGGDFDIAFLLEVFEIDGDFTIDPPA